MLISNPVKVRHSRMFLGAIQAKVRLDPNQNIRGESRRRCDNHSLPRPQFIPSLLDRFQRALPSRFPQFFVNLSDQAKIKNLLGHHFLLNS